MSNTRCTPPAPCKGVFRWLVAAACAATLAGCASAPPANVPFTTPGGVPIDVSVTARGQDSRVMFLIIH